MMAQAQPPQQQPSLQVFLWLGAGQQRADGRIQYSSFRLNSTDYRVGDCVFLFPEDESYPPYVARILSAFVDTQVQEGSDPHCIEPPTPTRLRGPNTAAGSGPVWGLPHGHAGKAAALHSSHHSQHPHAGSGADPHHMADPGEAGVCWGAAGLDGEGGDGGAGPEDDEEYSDPDNNHNDNRGGGGGPKTLCNACGVRYVRSQQKAAGQKRGGHKNGQKTDAARGQGARTKRKPHHGGGSSGED
eukprot:XP_001703731.1 predicted protein [Chlamydomonas reinhardtii]